MRQVFRGIGVWGAAFAVILVSGYGAADGAADPAEGSAIVARVGAKTITRRELEDRLATVPRFQLATFGSTPDAVRRKFLNDIVIPEVLYSLGAEERHIEADPALKRQVERARANATLRALRAQIGPASAMPMADVEKYYTDNKSRYDAPERVAIWRILCKTREEAVTVLADAKKDSTPMHFNQLARDHSQDKATNLRGGNLGFIAPDGTSNEAGLKVDPALVKAASSVKDGEFVSAPVAEGAGFAVIWRRGTVPATHRSVDDVKDQIKDMLFKQKVEQATTKLIADLRARDVSELNEDLLKGIEVPKPDGNIAPRPRPGQVPPLGPMAPAKKPQ